MLTGQGQQPPRHSEGLWVYNWLLLGVGGFLQPLPLQTEQPGGSRPLPTHTVSAHVPSLIPCPSMDHTITSAMSCL